MSTMWDLLQWDFTVVPGGTLVNTPAQLWSEFPYERASKLPLALWMNPLTPLVAVVVYLLSIPTLKWFCEVVLRPGAKEQEAAWRELFDESKAEKEKRLVKAERSKDAKAVSKWKQDLSSFTFDQFKATASPGFNGTKSPGFNFLVAIHNVVLVLFSGTVMIKATPVVFGVISESGWEAAYCDRGKSMWNETTFGYWATVFYLSKFYEFIDTWVLVAKCSTSTGKRVVPSTLQVYHHAGIALTMWGSTVSQGAWIAWVVIMNSTVHTVMYTYFFASTFGYKSPLAQYLTGLQLVQFFTGIFGTFFVHVLGESCDSSGSRLVLAGLQIYAVGLIFLFAAFFKRKYKAA